MGHRFLIINTDYREFLRWLYAQHPGLEQKTCEEQMRVRVESLFGVADFYSSNLRKLGHEAYNIIANNEMAQKQWARENRLKVEQLSNNKRQFKHVIQPWWSSAQLRTQSAIGRTYILSANARTSRNRE